MIARELKALSASDILGALRQSTASTPDVDPKVRRDYLRAAAVLTAIRNIDELNADAPSSPLDAKQVLGGMLMPASGSGFDGKVMLTPEARREALATFRDPAEIRNALDANPAERRSDLQKHFETYLLGKPKPLDAQDLNELRQTLQVSLWASGLLPSVPKAEDVRPRIELKQLLVHFEQLAGDDRFRGRKAEIDELRSFVGVVDPQSVVKRLGSKVYNWVRPAERAAMSLYGPGGVGKSALVARFMLEHTRVREDMKVPFAYLDFDRPTLDVSDPLGLVIEALKQLALQFPSHETYGRMSTWASDLAKSKGDQNVDRLNMARSVFADTLGTIESTLGPRPFIFVLDTFEEVQYRGETRATPLWEMLAELQKRWPFLRVVISGRAPVTSLRLAGVQPEPLELGGLDEESAIAILRADGFADEGLAKRVVRQVGSVPLSLKLVAEMYKRDLIEKGGIADLKTRSAFWISASAEVIQGQLYDRILGRIHDEQVRRLAHPGLVLRRVTPEVILHVLNEPCALNISTLDEARALFDALQEETSLVTVDDAEGALVHRSDLRRLMLGLLQQREPARVEHIHRNAVAWYEKQEGLRARAECLYHRASLGETIEKKDVAHPDVRSSLQASISELPAKVQATLASFGLQVSKDILEGASREEQDAAYQAQVEELLPYGRSATSQLSALLGEFERRLDRATPLFRTAARIFRNMDDDARAAELIEQGLTQSVAACRPLLTVELLAEKAWMMRQEKELPDVLDALSDYAQRENNKLYRLQERLQRLARVRAQPPARKSVNPHLAEETCTLVSQINSPQVAWDLFPALAPVAQQLAETRPDALVHVASLVVADESPFSTARFPNPRANDSLSRFIGAAYSALKDSPADAAQSFAYAITQLAKAWPYTLLQVRPPYGRSREHLVESAA